MSRIVALDLVYGGREMHDAATVDGEDPADADPRTSILFLRDGTLALARSTLRLLGLGTLGLLGYAQRTRCRR